MTASRVRANKNTRCVNCGTDRFLLRARGYCARCYPVLRKLEIVHSWDLDRPETLRGYSQLAVFYTKHGFNFLKNETLKRFQRRLDFLKTRERQRNSSIGGLEIEHLLRRLGKMCGVRDDVHQGVARYVEDVFTPEQRRVLFCLLSDIEERVPWRGGGGSRT